ncbi:MAG: methyl-accepting chemotaxis protein [bacterium]
MKKFKDIKSFKNKILFYIGAIFFIIAFLVIVVIGYVIYNILTEEAENKITLRLNCAAAEISLSNIESSAISKTVSISQQKVLFGKRENSVLLVNKILKENKHLTGASIGYEPNADGKDIANKSTSDKLNKGYDQTGRFLPYWYRDLINPSDIKLSILVDHNTSMYYDGVKERFYSSENEKSLITEPYIYEGKMMVEHCSPIVINNKFMGVACVDRALFDIDKFLLGLKPYKTAEFILISRLGKVISSTYDKSLKTKRITELTDYRVFESLYQKRENKILTTFNPNNDKNYYYACEEINPGSWLLIMRIEEEEILAPIKHTVYVSLGIALLGIIIFLIITNKIIGMQVKPLSEVIEKTKKIKDGLVLINFENVEEYEINELLIKLKLITERIQKLVKKIKENSQLAFTASNKIAITAEKQNVLIHQFVEDSGLLNEGISKISQNANSLAETMKDISEEADSTSIKSGNAINTLGEIFNNMTLLGNFTNKISKKLSILNEKTNNINTVLQTINKIADRTNLLSLNAAIEAEKAGEYGKGFSVIAREIRNLADQTIIATFDVEEQIGKLQNSVVSEVNEMERFTESVKEIIKNVNGISVNLKVNIQSFANLLPNFLLVRDGLNEQASVSFLINKSVFTLNNIAEANEIYINKFLSASENLSLAVSKLKNEIEYFKC